MSFNAAPNRTIIRNECQRTGHFENAIDTDDSTPNHSKPVEEENKEYENSQQPRHTGPIPRYRALGWDCGMSARGWQGTSLGKSSCSFVCGLELARYKSSDVWMEVKWKKNENNDNVRITGQKHVSAK